MNLGTIPQRLFARAVRSESGCLEWQGFRNPAGYGRIGNGDKHTMLAHRAAWIIANGDIPEGKHVLHSCDNPACIEVSHLFIGTPADNTRDKISKGRHRGWKQKTHPRGEESPTSKLKVEQVLAIKEDPRSQRVIAYMHGICQQTVSDIKRGRRWAHL